MRPFTIIIAAALVAAIRPALPGPQHPWARWKPGAYTAFEVSGTPGIAIERTVTLESVSPDGVLLRRKSTVNGRVVEDDATQYPLGIHLPSADRRSKPLGRKTITVQGRAYECSGWEFTAAPTPAPGGTVLKFAQERTAVWIASDHDVPLAVIEHESLGPARYVIELTATALNTAIDAGGKQFKATLMEGTLTFVKTGATTRVKRWVSAEVPGYLIREERVPPSGKTSLQSLVASAAK